MKKSRIQEPRARSKNKKIKAFTAVGTGSGFANFDLVKFAVLLPVGPR